MSENYLTYPFKTMRITQNYKGRTSHLPHTTGYPKDYPIDEGGKDGGRDYIYCPCDQMKIKRIYGVGNGGVNTIWLESTKKVHFADGTTDYCTMLITHPNDENLRNLSIGKVFKRGQAICREGTDGATANHLHISVGKGKYTGNGWSRNSNGKYVLSCTKGGKKPESLFYVDTSFTDVVSKGGIDFKVLQGDVYTLGNYTVTKISVLKVRTGAGKTYGYKKFNKLTVNAQKKILKLTGGVKKHGYVKGLTFTVTKVKKNWGKTASGWVNLDYCERIKG